MTEIIVSSLPKTWILDIDGVIFIHNGYLHGEDTLVSGFLELYQQISKEDYILLLTSREKKYEIITKKALKKFHIRYNQIIFDMPKGERIVINDTKPKGLQTAVSVNTKRNIIEDITVVVDQNR